MLEIVGVYIFFVCIQLFHFFIIYLRLSYVMSFAYFVDSMANTNNKLTIHSLRGILEKEKMTGDNYPNWHRNLRIVLR